MSEKYICPYCEITFVANHETTSSLMPSFNNNDLLGYLHHRPSTSFDDLHENLKESAIKIDFYHCPSCHRYSVELLGRGVKVSEINYRILPFGKSKKFPDYVPMAIREDYGEACLIKDLSPKASATLSRRCLQGMIRDFWKVEQSNLNRAINELEGKIPAPQWRVIHAVREIGNIGAHMEMDINKIINIDPKEADKLIELIEFLIDQWYINEYETERLFSNITEINDVKQKQRKE